MCLPSTGEVHLTRDSWQVPLQRSAAQRQVPVRSELHGGPSAIRSLAARPPAWSWRGERMHVQFSCQVVRQELFPSGYLLLRSDKATWTLVSSLPLELSCG